jgi:histidinol-phosphate aminotransferase
MRAFGAAGDSIVFSAPTFSMIPVLARLNWLTPLAIPFKDDFDLDAERLVDSRAKITYLCAPNNPTATPISRAAVEYVVANATGSRSHRRSLRRVRARSVHGHCRTE